MVSTKSLYQIKLFRLSICILALKKKKKSIQRTQTPPRLWHLTLWCDLEFLLRSRKLVSLDVAFCIVPWYQVWCLWVLCLTRYHHLFILCDLWPSPVNFNVCTKNEVCRFSRIWNMDNCMEKTYMMKRHPPCDFHENCKGISKRHTKILIDQTYESWDIQ